MKHECNALIGAIDAYIAKKEDNLEDILNSEGYADAAETVKEVTKLEKKIAVALISETDMVKSALKESNNLGDFIMRVWPQIKENKVLKNTLAKILVEEYSTIIPELATSYIAAVDPAMKVTNLTRKTTAWIHDWSVDLAEKMQLNSHSEIDRMLTAAFNEGMSIPAFTRELIESGLRNEHYKARRAALTELLRAHCYAQQEGYTQSPAVDEKMWMHTGAYRNTPRLNHVAMNGVRVPVNETFTLFGADGGIYHPMMPKDTSLPAGESINCHCIIQPVVSEKILGLPLEERQRMQAEIIAADDGAWEAEYDAQMKARAGIEEV